ncbi:MAG: [protein-PII] uridylyltransferase [Proteobacteria bacterium]|nr:[protein-PII] uridylyltransferase [Pseudomonadota bacterium]MDA0862721.1 [protein-PII] uridylyltransferase [Pseudomonadota bacterium]MDA1030900.1 [protein-PII] uridylyltransferase [Pseudomonadota bacterium]
MAGSKSPKEEALFVADLRAKIKQKKQRIFSKLDRKTDYQSLLSKHAKQTDALLRSLWKQKLATIDATLVAVGGYGRGSLFPYSDVDVLILISDTLKKTEETKIASFISTLWDIGLDVGHSVRKIDECIDESKKDISTQTNLMEARFLIGSKSLYSQFTKAISQNLEEKKFCDGKMVELKQRHSRYNDSFQNLEPNLKESPGGLRDLQTILWISQAAGYGSSWEAIRSSGIITKSEQLQLEKHERALILVRTLLHVQAGRKEDRLLFDFQRLLAAHLGFRTTSAKPATEQLMQVVFKASKSVSLLSSIILQHLTEIIHQERNTKPKSIDANFQIRNGFLETTSAGLFNKNPRLIFRFFSILHDHPEIKGISARTRKELWHAKKLINDGFRDDPENRSAFINFFKKQIGLTHTLRLMNQYDLLGKYLPEFGKICGQLQHDLFHVYTVDAHILMVVRNLRRFAAPDMSHEFPLCSKLIGSFKRPETLYIAGLFHDIAKGRGGDHSKLGMSDAKKFCEHHGLNTTDTNLVVWLVEQHLYMSTMAQKRDISDPLVVKEFVQKVKTQRRLEALYLLTVADIRGTSPKVWNGWKGKLLENLYYLALEHLKINPNKPQNLVETKIRNVKNRLTAYAIPNTTYDRLWSKFDESYFIRHEESEIVWHTRVINYQGSNNQSLVKARLSPIGDGLQVLTYGKNEPLVFARICSFFEDTEFSVVEAKVFTTKDNYYLNTFQVLIDRYAENDYQDMINHIEHALPMALSSSSLPKSNKGRISRRLQYFPIKPEVDIRGDENGLNYYLQITCGDQPGLLYAIARILTKHQVDIKNAKINTLGERVEDTLLISGDVLSSARETLRLQSDLVEELSLAHKSKEMATR